MSPGCRCSSPLPFTPREAVRFTFELVCVPAAAAAAAAAVTSEACASNKSHSLVASPRAAPRASVCVYVCGFARFTASRYISLASACAVPLLFYKPLSILYSPASAPLEVVCQECLLHVCGEDCIECNSFPNECHASVECFNECLKLLYLCLCVCVC